MKFMSLGAALSLDMGALVSKMLPLCEMQLVKCSLSQKKTSRAARRPVTVIPHEGRSQGIELHRRLSREVSRDTKMCPPTVSRLLTWTAIHAQLS